MEKKGKGSVQHYFKAGIVFKGPPGERYHPQTLTDVILLSWIDLRPFAMVPLCSDLAPCGFCHLSLQGRTSKEERSEFHFTSFCFVFLSSQPLHGLC